MIRSRLSFPAVRMITVLAVAELLGMSVWLAASAVTPELRDRWQLSATEAGWLTSAVQLGFVAGTLIAAILNLADLVSHRLYFALGAGVAAISNLALLAVPGWEAALGARFVTGFALAAVYPPAMKMAATWFQGARGLAIGIIVGALTLGKATPYLVEALGGAGLRPVILATSAGALAAGLLVAVGYRDGPYPFARRPFAWSLVALVWRDPAWRRTTASYSGHMLELYACWTWLATFLGMALGAGGGPVSNRVVSFAAFGAIGVGSIACVWGGWMADRIGRERLVRGAMAGSGLAALGIGATYGGHPALLFLTAGVWGWFVIADSAQFSALITERVPAHAVGTALTLQTSVGFALSTVTIQLVPWLAGRIGWQWAMAVLAVGPALGIVALRKGGAGSSRAQSLAADLPPRQP